LDELDLSDGRGVIGGGRFNFEFLVKNFKLKLKTRLESWSKNSKDKLNELEHGSRVQTRPRSEISGLKIGVNKEPNALKARIIQRNIQRV
jgi:hypothetical protein